MGVMGEGEEMSGRARADSEPLAGETPDEIDRRQFLGLLGASLGLAGLTGCTRQPPEQIAPYVRQPEALIPGRPLFFATAVPHAGFATGVLVESHEGRPTKIEGNPDHPASLGATDHFAQAAVLSLYDPDRAQAVTHQGDIRPYAAFLATAQAVRGRGGDGLRLLTGTVTSPTLAAQIRALLAELPGARWHQHEPAEGGGALAGALLAFGAPVHTLYRLERADRVLSIDADFLQCGPASLRQVRDFARRRRPEEGPLSRLYVVESTPSNTGAKADHRLPLRPSQIEPFTRSLAAALGVAAGAAAPAGASAAWITALTRDLLDHRGRCIIVPGPYQGAVVHALCHAMNHALGNAGQTVVYTDPVEAAPVDPHASLVELSRDMEAGRVETLVILGGNPVYTAPADLRFGERLGRVGLRVHLSAYQDETAARCHWHIPESHLLESWGDVRAYDGTVTILQPLIAPLYASHTAYEVLAALGAQPERSTHDIVRDHWRAASGVADFESLWRRALHSGVVPGTALSPREVILRDLVELPPPAAPAQGMELVFRPDPTIYDGRFANNAWLQEMPKPLTRLTWDNAALISPRTARRLGLSHRVGMQGGEIVADVVELTVQGRSLRAPVWITPGQPDEVVTVHLGYGRTRAGRVGTGVGFDAYALRTSAAPWYAAGLSVRRTGAEHRLASVQIHHLMEGRDLVRAVTEEEHHRRPELARGRAPHPRTALSLYPEFAYPDHAWGMAIDLSTCVGCGACVVACQAENNIPVVGKPEVLRGREMHWLRIDVYYQGREDSAGPDGRDGGLDNPATYFQPVPCMHCEKAPCEVVCPVAATVHHAEGLNDMVYNRCVGTRYCSNNCPYKVRRFNFLRYADFDTPQLRLLRNPDVTVRSRGVMEKCTYCVQRINGARAQAELEGRKVRDGEVKTACQAACPADAIVFGDINDASSRVARLKALARSYALLADLQTQPRTTYLAALRAPNPALTGGGGG